MSLKETAPSLAHTLLSDKHELVAAAATSDFYIEWAVIAFAIAISWLIGLLIRKRLTARLAAKPIKFIDAEFITKPASLLAPLLVLIYLNISKPFIANIGGGMWLEAVSQITAAYIAAKTVLLIVRSRAIAWFIASVIMLIAVLDTTGLMAPVTEYLGSVKFSVAKYEITLLGVIHGIIILILVFWAAGILSNTLESYLRRSSAMSYNARELTVKFFNIFVYITAIMITLSAVGVDLTAFAVFGGALGVGIGLGLQKITANFVSGITLLLEKSIQIGDLVEIDNMSGFVRQLNIRYTLIETNDGRDVMVPNEEMTSKAVVNWTHTTNRARVEIKASIAYDADAQLAKKLMLEAAREHPKCINEPEPTCWMREFADSGINFLLVFWISDVKDGRYGPQSDVMFAILDKFKKSGIVIPVSQVVARPRGN